MKKFVIDEDFANAVLSFLIKQPFEQVHLYVKGFQELEYLEMYESRMQKEKEETKSQD